MLQTLQPGILGTIVSHLSFRDFLVIVTCLSHATTKLWDPKTKYTFIWQLQKPYSIPAWIVHLPRNTCEKLCFVHDYTFSPEDVSVLLPFVKSFTKIQWLLSNAVIQRDIIVTHAIRTTQTELLNWVLQTRCVITPAHIYCALRRETTYSKMVRLLLEHKHTTHKIWMFDPDVRIYIFEKACEQPNNFEFVTWFFARFCALSRLKPKHIMKFIDASCKGTDVQTFKWLVRMAHEKNIELSDCLEHAFVNACTYGALEIVKCKSIFRNTTRTTDMKWCAFLVHRAAGLGHLNIVIYLVGLFHLSARHIYAEDGDIRAWALENDCLDIVIWLTSKFGTNNKYMRKHAVSWRHMLLMSCNNKDVDCTKWVLENMPLDTYTNHCFLTAVNVGSTEILDLLVLHGIKPEPFSWHVLEQNNLWNVAEWMVKKLSYEQRNVVFNNRTICFMHWDHIPDKFKKDWLKYTHTHRTDGVDMLNAIADGKIYFVHFLIFELHFPNIDVPIELDDDMLFSLSPTQLQKLQEINECIKN